MKKNNIYRLITGFLSGALLTLAFSPYDFWIIGFVSPAILFRLWHRTRPVEAFYLGYIYGLGMFGVGVNWLHISINMFGGVNLVGSYIITYALVTFLALYPAFVGFISRKYFSRNETLFLLLIVPALWAFTEWCRSWIFTGFPWLNLGYTQTDTWLAGFAPVFGVYGISWLTALIAALIACVFIAGKKQKILACVAIFFITIVSFPISKIQWTTPDNKTRNVVLVQAAIPQELKWKPESLERTIDLYTGLSQPYWDSDLIIWPETAIPLLFSQAKPLIEALQQQAMIHQTDMLTGIPERDEETHQYFNTIISIGTQPDMYKKRHLVPFGEYLPLDQWIRPVLDLMGIPMSSFSSGSGKPILYAAGIPIGVSICYEDVFGEEVIDALPEARLLVNVSNDAWFGDSLAPHQHLQMARMRALETGRYLLRATNTGISAIIDEKGRITGESPQFQPDALHRTIKTFSGSTPYSLYGNYVIVIMSILVLVVCFVLNRKKI